MSNHDHQFEEIAAEANIGHLGIITADGYPRVVPVNFVAVEDKVYFHGANSGEKCGAFAENPKVSFSIDIPYSMIPSYWRSEKYACPATQYFKSALVKGRGAIVDDPHEKAVALQALMVKHQPEGRFDELKYDDPLYRKPIDEVALFRIDPDSIDTRFKFGQNQKDRVRATIVKKLKERGHDLDLKTAAEMTRHAADRSYSKE